MNPAKRWCFTLHNHTVDDIENIKKVCEQFCKFTIIGDELGKEGKTPHLQGYLEFISKKRPKQMFINKTIHWEVAKGSQDDNVFYCSKERTLWKYPKVYTIDIELRQWQKDIIDILDGEPNDRTVHWYFDIKGGAGKSTFIKYLRLKYQHSLTLSGKGDDMKFAVIKFVEKFGFTPKIILIDICRSQQHISFSGIEAIKNMHFFCGKYETGEVLGPCPHVFCFANVPPDMTMLSYDRWIITNLSPETTPAVLFQG